MNKYIIKVAFLARGISGLAKGIGSIGSAIGKQVHYASGGAYRDYAFRNMGITDPRQLAKISDNKESIKKILAHYKTTANFQALPKASNPAFKSSLSPEQRSAINNFKEDRLKDLKNKTINGRIATGVMVGGSLYAGAKVLNNQSNQYQYQY